MQPSSRQRFSNIRLPMADESIRMVLQWANVKRSRVTYPPSRPSLSWCSLS